MSPTSVIPGPLSGSMWIFLFLPLMFWNFPVMCLGVGLFLCTTLNPLNRNSCASDLQSCLIISLIHPLASNFLLSLIGIPSVCILSLFDLILFFVSSVFYLVSSVYFLWDLLNFIFCCYYSFLLSYFLLIHIYHNCKNFFFSLWKFLFHSFLFLFCRFHIFFPALEDTNDRVLSSLCVVSLSPNLFFSSFFSLWLLHYFFEVSWSGWFPVYRISTNIRLAFHVC